MLVSILWWKTQTSGSTITFQYKILSIIYLCASDDQSDSTSIETKKPRDKKFYHSDPSIQHSLVLFSPNYNSERTNTSRCAFISMASNGIEEK